MKILRPSALIKENGWTQLASTRTNKNGTTSYCMSAAMKKYLKDSKLSLEEWAEFRNCVESMIPWKYPITVYNDSTLADKSSVMNILKEAEREVLDKHNLP